jgi:Zn-dependent peptidase ImmA (M78 family)/DNA-binding XRE family transcriptional regulator
LIGAVIAQTERDVQREQFTKWTDVASQVIRARERAGFSQGDLAQRVGLSRSSLTRVELGQRRLDALELVRLAQATGRSVEWFVSSSPDVFASHRAGLGAGQDVTELEDRLESSARDVELLVDIGVLILSPARLPWGVSTLQEAEAGAVLARELLGQPGGPAIQLQSLVERLGLLAFGFEFGSDAIDGGYVRIGDVGVALINGSADAGRRRFNLAHELGHHLLADEYTVDFGLASAPAEREALINAFAIHFLLPRGSVTARWNELAVEWEDPRMRLVVLAAEYRVSWSAMVSQALTLGLIDRGQHDVLKVRRPVSGDYIETGVRFVEELPPPALPTAYSQAVVRAYRRGLIGATRAVELLHGTLNREGLPLPAEAPIESLKREFTDIG